MPRLTIIVVAPDPEPGASSLSPAHQRGVAAGDYEVVVVETAGEPPGAAVDRTVAASTAPAIGIMADGSRAVASGAVAAALHCLSGLDRVVLAAGPGLVFLPRDLLEELGGYDDRDFPRRVARLEGVDALTLGLPAPSADRYLSLLKQTLLNEPGLEAEAAYFIARDALEAAGVAFDETIAFDVRARKPGYFERLRQARDNGFHMGWTTRNAGFPYTMVGRARLENVAECVATALADDVPGDLVECGVWRGGVTILMRGILAAHGVDDRTVWVADSFEGLPAPESAEEELDLSKEPHPELAVTQERVSASFERFGLLDDHVRFLPGWFKDTLPAAPIERIAVLRLDGDLYESTMTTLTALYDKVSPGGFVIVDDYKLLEECRQAVDEFRASRGIEDPIVEVDWTGVYWRRSR